tara:strand:+ start:33 stop:137 length:105 start_codon:yes stop_codon:yes gene_type:complete
VVVEVVLKEQTLAQQVEVELVDIVHLFLEEQQKI